MIHVEHRLAAALLALVVASSALADKALDDPPPAARRRPVPPRNPTLGHWALLEPSTRPADADECERAHPARGRPEMTVNIRYRSNEPYQRRLCWWRGHEAGKRVSSP